MRRDWRAAGAALFAAVALATFAGADEIIEMATYIPAPTSSETAMDRLHVRRATVGDDPPLSFSLSNPANPDPPNGTLLVAGNVGVGTASPFGPLHVDSAASQGAIHASGASDNGDSFSGLYLHDASADFNNNWVIAHKNRPGTPEAGTLQFVRWTNPATALAAIVIQPAGNVGIGTTDPQARLHIGPALRPLVISPQIESAGEGGEIILATRDPVTANATWHIDTQFAPAAERLRIFRQPNIDSAGLEFFSVNSDGNVGIGTANAGGRLHIRGPGAGGGVVMEPGDGSAGWYVWASDAGNFYVYDRVNSVPRVTIKPNGRVGIGTTNPLYQLQLSSNSAAKPGGGSWSASSDARLKRDVAPIRNALKTITALRGVTFEWIHPELHGETGRVGGFLGQEVGTVMPRWISEIPAEGAEKQLVNGGTVKALTLSFEFDAYVVEAIKELKAENDALKGRMALLERKLSDRAGVKEKEGESPGGRGRRTLE